MRACSCGMPDLWGLSWAVWHRLHEQQHLHTYPNLDERSRGNLRDMARPVEISLTVTEAQAQAEADMLRDHYGQQLTLAMPLLERDHDPRTVEILRG